MKHGMLAILIITALLSGCGSARRGVAGRELPEIQSRELQRGRAVFERNCSRCHPGGEGGLGPALNDKALPPFIIRFQVRNGAGVMPAFSEDEISDDELDILVDYVRFLRDPDPE